MLDLSVLLFIEIPETNLNMEMFKYMDNQVREPSQTLNNYVKKKLYAKDCTIYGESEFESFSFDEPTYAKKNTKSFESFDEPSSANPILFELDLLNNSLLMEILNLC